MTYLLQALSARAGEFISLRRDIHRHPGLAFVEHRTAALVANKLAGWGCAVETGIGGTGVVGTLVRGTGRKRLGLRADMDALPIAEASGAEWASVNRGVMHACGHDGHTAMLLAAARHLAEEGCFDGTLHLIFQPAEEGGGGALRMMEDGLFKRFPCDGWNLACARSTTGVRATLARRIKALVAAQAESFGVTALVDWKPGYAVPVNTPAKTAFARRVAVELVGADKVTPQGPPLTGSEDFAFMLEQVPGSCVLVGNGDGDSAGACMVHNPGYDFNDNNVAIGSAYWVLLAERFLTRQESRTTH